LSARRQRGARAPDRQAPGWGLGAVRPWLRRRGPEAFASAEIIEFMRADICRPDLLVEIEGRAELAGARAPVRVGAEVG
jgi:hypothetical protein